MPKRRQSAPRGRTQPRAVAKAPADPSPVRRRLAQMQQAVADGPSIIPPKAGAPPARYPVAVQPHDRALAPVPINDRFPIVVGQSLNLSYAANVFRLCTTGYRQQYVDFLNELIEHDPHLYAVLQKRVLGVATGRVEVTACDLEEDHEDYDRAEEIADEFRLEVEQLPDLTMTLAGLLWGGLYYGLSTCENHWTRDADGWHIQRLAFVHSRRLAYPDYQSWDLYIWDQGQVYGWTTPWGLAPTSSGIFGLRIADWPGKFTVHAPQIRGDYPTREGLGREIAVWCLLKRIAGRGGSDYLERWAKMFADVSWSTSDQGKPREATTEDISAAMAAVDGLGPGLGSGWAHPDSVKFESKPGDPGRPKLTFSDWIKICNAEMSKAVLGGTLGTEPTGGGLGGKGLGDVQERREVELDKYDAACLSQTLERDVVHWWMRLNHPDETHLRPRIRVQIEKDPDPKSVAELAKILTLIGCPVDADNLADDVGIQLVPNDLKDDSGKPKPRRTFMSDVLEPTVVDPNLMSEEAKQQDADDRKAKTDAMAQRAQMLQQSKTNGAMNGAPPNGASAKPAAPKPTTTPPAKA